MPGVYIEASYDGHKAIPGTYRFTLKMGTQSAVTEAEIQPNPLYPTTASGYREYHAIMSQMETDVTAMHKAVNSLYEKQKQLEAIHAALPAGDKFAAVKRDADALLKKMKAWDDAMVQRKAKAYDDVENFVNMFTANYLFLVNQTESDVPRVNQSSLDMLEKMNAEWTALRRRSEDILGTDLPALNKKLWDLGYGAIWKN